MARLVANLVSAFSKRELKYLRGASLTGRSLSNVFFAAGKSAGNAFCLAFILSKSGVVCCLQWEQD